MKPSRRSTDWKHATRATSEGSNNKISITRPHLGICTYRNHKFPFEAPVLPKLGTKQTMPYNQALNIHTQIQKIKRGFLGGGGGGQIGDLQGYIHWLRILTRTLAWPPYTPGRIWGYLLETFISSIFQLPLECRGVPEA